MNSIFFVSDYYRFILMQQQRLTRPISLAFYIAFSYQQCVQYTDTLERVHRLNRENDIIKSLSVKITMFTKIISFQ